MNGEFRSDPEQGYFIQSCSSSGSPQVQHSLGGVRKGNPHCPSCDTTLLTLVQLGKSDERLDLGLVPMRALPLLVCDQCFLFRMTYSLTSAGEVLVEPLKEGAQGRIHQDGWIEAIKCEPVVLHAIPDRIMATRRLAREGRLSEAEGWVERFDWSRPKSQVGGFPLLMNCELCAPNCLFCEEEMTFFATMVVDVRSSINSETQVFQMLYFLCRGCLNVAAIPDLPMVNYS